ncbi:hypothetical protein K449DRAFT_381030, partial [Hypoxylon sp. EC38]
MAVITLCWAKVRYKFLLFLFLVVFGVASLKVVLSDRVLTEFPVLQQLQSPAHVARRLPGPGKMLLTTTTTTRV